MLDVLKFKSPNVGSTKDKGRIEVKDVSITFGKGSSAHRAVDTTEITIEAGQFVCILGPSGCGKSTLLNAIAGYVKPTEGTLLVDGTEVDKPGPDRGMVFQQYSLLPWKTVYENVAFGPKMAGHSRVEAGSTANTFLELVGLKKFGDRYPAELSGGMQQRVGIARALANYPSVLLMDEPFGALDAQTRLMMQESLLDIWRKFGTTVVFVTHDVDEAVFLADRVLIMSTAPGRIIEDVKIDLPRPRSTDMASSPEYVQARQFCLDTIKAESRKAFENQNS
ncbi:NitT/TauT family transport system ATP-binding protein [Thalassococcus halodurans]|uniref:NitT/TauT family transport system ATP-binding protein n=1 Tax=Thalassococcus halodurans TaxID=373675 RepID=A0A1H5WIV8_9RHOB|nr:ABC transporter ATP-binding protein [Thalassococcus halodurans]SEF99404.1 NitT/TauT family transport system ATP-binding protein [Thalassococcus halodurans]